MKDRLKITDDGVEFRSHHDGSRHLFTPERVMEIEHAIGADIIMAFDQCVEYPADRKLAETGVRRTHDWCKRSSLVIPSCLNQARGGHCRLFGIVQGSTYEIFGRSRRSN